MNILTLTEDMLLKNKCCICGDSGETHFKINCDGPVIGVFKIKKCKRCSLLYLDPYLKQKILDSLYSDNYFDAHYFPFEKQKIAYFE